MRLISWEDFFRDSYDSCQVSREDFFEWRVEAPLMPDWREAKYGTIIFWL